MAGLQRDRGCFYYIPWIAIFSTLLLGGSLGVWIHFGLETYNDSKDTLDTLGVDAYNLNRSKPAVIATSCVYLFIVILMVLLSLVRSFIEAAHDATGLAGPGSTVWMVFNVLVSVCWWLITLWLTVLIAGSAVWVSVVYVLRGSIDNLITTWGPQPSVTWQPSTNTPCPGVCLNLTLYTFISSSLSSSCICNYDTLRSAQGSLDDAFKWGGAMLGGLWGILLASLFLLVNFACQYAHTNREREYIRRLTNKAFLGI